MQRFENMSGCDHQWQEEYYGNRCKKCDLFYIHGCAPWDYYGDDVGTDYVAAWLDSDEDYDGKEEKEYERQDRLLRLRIEEMKDHLNLNYETWDDDGEGFTDEDAIDHLMDECGQDGDGSCSMAGTEYCDWECPFNS